MRTFVFLLALLSPFPALALSCVRPSVERTFAEVQAADEAYIVVKGRLTLNARKLPRDGPTTQNPPELTRVPANLIGKSMNASGFVVPFDQTVTLEVSCLGPWCGSVENGQQVLAFVKRTAGQYALSVAPCGGRAFPNPTKANLKKALTCFKDGACTTR